MQEANVSLLFPSRYLEVSLLSPAWMKLPENWLLAGYEGSQLRNRHPDFCFLIRHPLLKKQLVFDLAIRKDLGNNPLIIRKDYPTLELEVPYDVADILLAENIKPASIDYVVYSHLHFDHVGDISKFPNADLVIGPGSMEAASHAYPEKEMSPFMSSALDHPVVRELSRTKDKWVTIAGFPAFDFFGDGTFFLCDAPGHMAGNLLALARTGRDEWIAMGGDCCHDRKLFASMGYTISTSNGPGGAAGMHSDVIAAKSTIEKIKILNMDSNVLVVLAHDRHCEGVLPLIPNRLNGWKQKQWKAEIATQSGDDMVPT